MKLLFEGEGKSTVGPKALEPLKRVSRSSGGLHRVDKLHADRGGTPSTGLDAELSKGNGEISGGDRVVVRLTRDPPLTGDNSVKS